MTPMNAEKMVDEEREVASRFLVTCQGQAVKLSLAGKSVSYAGTPVAAVTLEPEDAYRLEGIGLQAEYTLTEDQPHTLKMELTGEGNYETMAFTTEIMGGSCVKNISISVPDKNGTAELMLDTTDPGRATLRITEKISGYAYTVQLIVVPAEKQ